jgi:hydroxyacylglutathione hydrolase
MLSLRPLPAFQDNYIWTLVDEDSRHALFVDPGDAGPVLEAVAGGLVPVAILLTHHHPDHVGGVPRLLAEFDIPCHAPLDARIGFPTTPVGDGDQVEVPSLGLRFDVLAVPGHTRSHVAYAGGGMLFCGDTLFSLGCGRLFEGSPAQMLASLDRLAALPSDTLVCCGHEYTVANGRFAQAAEPDNATRDAHLARVEGLRRAGQPSLPSRLGLERECNPFLRVDSASLRAALRSRGEDAPARVDRFASLRQWKDGFAA